jgi:hypothetical protein
MRRFDGNVNRWFLDPLLRGEYPADMVEWYGDDAAASPPFARISRSMSSSWRTTSSDAHAGSGGVVKLVPLGVSRNRQSYHSGPTLPTKTGIVRGVRAWSRWRQLHRRGSAPRVRAPSQGPPPVCLACFS